MAVESRDGRRLLDLENRAEGHAERGQNHRAPEDFTEHCRHEEHGGRLFAVAAVEQVDHRGEAVPPHGSGEEQPAQNQRQRVTPGGLRGDDAVGVDIFGRAVDVAAVEPGGGHRQHAQHEGQPAAGQEQPVGRLVLLRAPADVGPEGEKNRVEQRNRDQPGRADAHNSTRAPLPRKEVGGTVTGRARVSPATSAIRRQRSDLQRQRPTQLRRQRSDINCQTGCASWRSVGGVFGRSR